MPCERLQAEQRLREMLSSADPFPRAVFATTDEQALATMRAVFSLRLRVPEDLALIGFDGISEALHGWVRLTTASVPLHELAVRAFDTRETRNSDGQELSEVLPVTLAVGDTCGCT